MKKKRFREVEPHLPKVTDIQVVLSSGLSNLKPASLRLSGAMPKGLGIQGGGFLLKTLAASEHKAGSHPS